MLTVSIGDFRNNISQYLGKVRSGNRVLIKDIKRNLTIAQVTGVHVFDKDSYQKTIKKASGVFSSQKHPEWKDRRAISSWLSKSRLTDDRKF